MGMMRIVVCLVLVGFWGLMVGAEQGRGGRAYWVYVGNYGKGEKHGIYLFRMDATTGELTAAGDGGIAAAAENPNFLAVHPSGKFLYAVTTATVAGNAGAMEAFAVDAATGKLTPLNRVGSGGPEPVHLAVDPAGRVVAAANYSGASVALFQIGPDGKLGEASAVVKHAGSSVDPVRQKQAYAHGVAFDRDGKRVLVADLGLDKIFVYDVDAQKGTLTECGEGAKVEAGSGPRHLAFGADGRFVYAISEMSNTVDVFAYSAKGELTFVQRVKPWAAAAAGKDFGAEVMVDASGKFLVASERGKINSVAVMAIDEATGKLKAVETVESGGEFPRGLGMDPSGKFLLVGNQKSDSMSVFAVDGKGMLNPVGKVAVPSPVSVVFGAVRGVK